MLSPRLGVLGLLAISACSPGTPAKSVSLADGQIIATAPSGYCIDDIASQLNSDFAVLAPCASLGEGTPAPDVLGLVTLQVGPAESGAVAQDELALRDFLITDAGASLLSSEGDAAKVTILSTQAFNNQVMVHFEDQGTPPIAGLQDEEWRAFADINGRLVTIAVRGLATAPLRDGPGAGLLKLMLAGVKSVTSDTPQTASDA